MNKPMEIATIAKKAGLTQFEPAKAGVMDAALSAAVVYAAKVQDWAQVEASIEDKVANQKAFVGWWGSEVGKNHGGNRKQVCSTAHLSLKDAEKLTGIQHHQVSRWNKSLEDEEGYKARLFNAVYRPAMGEDESHNHRAQGTGENEWYTPSIYLESARTVLGAINLDPASSEIAQRAVRAEQFFTAKDNGLLQEWHGRIWLNPPYSQPAIHQFVSKLVSEVQAGRATAAILLTHNYTDTAWFHEAANAAQAMCFTRGRIKFVDANGGYCAPTQGQAFSYFGGDVEAFRTEFARFGFVVRGA